MALEQHAHYYDAKAMVQPDFQVGDKVWLSSKNIHTTRPTKKLDYPFICQTILTTFAFMKVHL